VIFLMRWLKMTREKLYQQILPTVKERYCFDDLSEIVETGATEFVLDLVYSHFESRTCASCKHYQYDSCQKLTYFDGEYEITPINSCPDFGCLKWDPKDG